MNAPYSKKAFLKAVTPEDNQRNVRPLNLLLQAAARTFGDYLQSQQSGQPLQKREQLRSQCQRLAADIMLLDADNADALNLLARLALDDNAIADARFLLTRALEKHPENAGCHYSYGHVMLAEKQYTQATESFQRAIHIDGNQLRFYTSLAYSLQKQGNYQDATNIYRRLRLRHHHDAHINSQLLACLNRLDVDHYDTALEQDLVAYLDDEQGDLQYLAKPAAELLTHKYLLTDPNSTIAFEKLVTDPLLLAALPHVRFESPLLENLLIAARRNVLEISLYTGTMTEETENFIAALALHNLNNGYIHGQSMAEQGMVENILTALHEDSHSEKPAEDTSMGQLFLLACLYRHPLDIANETALYGPQQQWSEPARQLWQHASIPCDAPVAAMPQQRHDFSVAMRAQYEHAPYPQWKQLHHRTPTRYRDALCAELSGFASPDFLNSGENLRILVAGCGTGRQAIHIAKYFINVQVTAIDLSQNSLRYAQKMADMLDVDNVTFLQGDILDLDMKQTFHIIECSGVLHHIEEESLAMQKMLAHLHPAGLLKLGLYSARARQLIDECRELIHTLGLSTGVQDVRDFRQLIMARAQEDRRYRRITHSPDFYSYNGCIDLLFNIYERHYEPADISELLEKHHLKFLGFTGLPENVREQYLQQFSDDPPLTNLQHWDQLEQQQPDLFAGMYQFYMSRQ